MTLAAVEHAAQWSFGVAPDTALDDNADVWRTNQVVGNHSANERWFDAVRSARRTLHGGKPIVALAVQEQPTCWRAWGDLHGVNRTTMKTIHDKVLKGEQQWGSDSTKEVRKMESKLSADLAEEATSWWHTRLQYYEFRTKHGVIAHPR